MKNKVKEGQNKLEIQDDKGNAYSENKIETEILPIESKEANKNTTIINNGENQKEIKNSVLGSAMTITNVCLGTTIFAFGTRTKAFGLVWYNIVAILCALIGCWTIWRQVLGSQHMKESEYGKIMKVLFGRGWQIAINVILILYCVGLAMALLTIIYALIGRFIESVFYHGQYNSYENFAEDIWSQAKLKYPINICLSLLLGLVCSLKDMNKLHFMSYISVGTVIYTLLVVTIQCNSYYNHYKEKEYIKEEPNTHVNWVNLGKAFTNDLMFCKGMSNLFFAYACQNSIYPIYNTFKPEGEKGTQKMKKAIFFGQFMVCLIHILSITVCFLTEPIYPQDLIIYRVPKNKEDKDIAMNIAKVAVAISLFFTVPANFAGVRACLSDICFGGNIPDLYNYIINFTLMVVLGVITCVYDKILSYLNYLGGFLSPFFCFVFPLMIYLKNCGKPLTYWLNILEIIGVIILTIIGLISGIMTIIDDVKK